MKKINSPFAIKHFYLDCKFAGNIFLNQTLAHRDEIEVGFPDSGAPQTKMLCCIAGIHKQSGCFARLQTEFLFPYRKSPAVGQELLNVICLFKLVLFACLVGSVGVASSG